MLEQSLSKEESWRLRINDYRSSGLTAKEWCSQNQFPLSTLHYWVSRLNKTQDCNEDDFKPIFAELPVLTAVSLLGVTPVTIHLGMIRIEIMDSCHPDMLSNLIGILKNHA